MSNITLRPLQVDGVDFLLKKERAILADQVGLGKTYTSIEASLQSIGGPDCGYVLVVVPNHLMLQWLDAFSRYANFEPTVIDRKHPFDRSMPAGFYLCNYQMLQRAGRKASPEIWRKYWDVIIYDEAHRLKDAKTQQTQNARNILSRRAYLLTGSPITKNESDIFGLLHIVNPTEFRSYWQFVDKYMVVIETPWSKEVIGVKDTEREGYTKELAKYMLRRESNAYPIRVQEIPVQMSPSTRKMHATALKSWRIENEDSDPSYYAQSGGALAIKLRRELSQPQHVKPKLDALDDIIADLPNDQKIIIFCWFRETAQMLTDHIDLHYPKRFAWRVDGSITGQMRQNAIDAWKNNEGSEHGAVLVGTLATMSEGLNLQETNQVIFFEQNYVPLTQEQAIGRVTREGQRESYIVAHFIYFHRSIESKLRAISERRGINHAKALTDAMMYDADLT
jgi:SNF2 family DNA or RNA helicase